MSEKVNHLKLAPITVTSEGVQAWTQYELVNPMDPIMFHAPDFKTAVCAVMIIGAGRFGMRDEQGKSLMPLMLFKLDVPFFIQHFGSFEDYKTFLTKDENMSIVAMVLESFAIVDGKEVTSMLDICKVAKKIAHAIKEKVKRESNVLPTTDKQ